MKYLLIVVAVVIGMMMLRKSFKSGEELWKKHIKTSGITNYDAVIDGIEYASREIGIRPEIIAAVAYAESKYDSYAKGDWGIDVFGERFMSFGLMQINTYKSKLNQWGTFDFICEYLREHTLIKKWKLNDINRRNAEIQKAQDDYSSVLYNKRLNALLGAWYLKKAAESLGLCDALTINDVLKIAYRYNAGIGADESRFDEWKKKRTAYVADISAVLRFCGWLG